MAERIVVAMSGGVDSSVAAALLVEGGYEVVGIMLRLWSDGEGTRHNRCCTPADTNLARRVAAVLDIPFYLLDVTEPFKAQVVDPFISDYLRGRTPNPCLNCNRYIRFDWLLDKAMGLGASKLATGHYARCRQVDEETSGQGDKETSRQGDIRIHRMPLAGTTVAEETSRQGDRWQLLRGVDRTKDQSYVLSLLTQAQLARVMFPLGKLTKREVRQIAERKGLPVANKPDSQDLCFVSEGDYRRFLARHAPPGSIRPGPIYDTSGQVIGQHKGLPFYTIGQRRGLEISGPEKLYVKRFIPEENALVVGTTAELGDDECVVRGLNLISQHVLPGLRSSQPQPFRASVKIRYKADEVNATVTLAGDGAYVKFDRPLRDITPGQAAVFYDGEIVIGGGIISNL